MAPAREPLGHFELEVLQYLADHQPATVRQVATHFASTSGQARTTILTVMERLRAKGYLKRRKIGNLQHYATTVTKTDLLQQIVGDFVHDVLGGSVSPFVAYLSQSPLLSEEEGRKLHALLKRIESREQGTEP